MRDSTLMLAARQLRIHSTHQTDIYLRVVSNPIIEHSSGVRFAPYALSYPGAVEVRRGVWADGWARQESAGLSSLARHLPLHLE